MKDVYRGQHQMTSLRELFKIIISVAIVNAVRTWIGEDPAHRLFTTSSFGNRGDHSLFVVFILVVIRYYYGNDLHLLEDYSAHQHHRATARRLQIDFLGFFVEGLLLAALSFYIRDVDTFSALLCALFFVDFGWFALTPKPPSHPAKTRHHVDHRIVWLSINLVAATALLALRVFMWEQWKASSIDSGHRYVATVLVAAAHTIADVTINHDFYFAQYRKVGNDFRVMVGAAFTAKLSTQGKWSDPDMRYIIESINKTLRDELQATVYCAHIIENFGQSLRQPKRYVSEDVSNARSCACYIAILEDVPSPGMAAELAVAAASGAYIVGLLSEQTTASAFLVELVRSHGRLLTYKSKEEPKDLARSAVEAWLRSGPVEFGATDSFGDVAPQSHATPRDPRHETKRPRRGR